MLLLVFSIIRTVAYMQNSLILKQCFQFKVIGAQTNGLFLNTGISPPNSIEGLPPSGSRVLPGDAGAKIQRHAKLDVPIDNREV